MTGHGGNIYAASKKTGIPENRILDFSASINFLGVPEQAALLMKRHIKDLPHYPEPFSEQLSMHIGKKFRVDEESIICGNGSTELIYLIPRALKPKKVLIPAPTFSEYEKSCSAGNASKIVRYELQPDDNFRIDPDVFIEAMGGGRNKRASQSCNMAFLCNPNNPTGQVLSKMDVMRIAAAANKMRCYLVVDEAFIDYCPECSVMKEVRDNPYLIVIRSMTKFYALSGLRIGYGVFPHSIISTIRQYKEPWTVNTLAQKAGVAALNDKPYQKSSLKAMGREKLFVEKALVSAGIDFILSRANYYLLRIKNARNVIAALERKGILVRDCSNFIGLDDTYIRIAVRSRKENKILMKELATLCGR